ncbi:flavodoxin domain-containing protein [Scatolibacter rhodanostii]|uniref:flavodoxin domain-containing protein n=1 Tax=Scatolibacter rhodanostii TaxID=2014781 RepID=UPI000C07215B|nr:flavodoxin domain-containing protein [Scatolibacter rhodanostii]
MKKIAVIYKSKYGATGRYARWLAEELGAELFEKSQVPASALGEFDLILYGGGVYAGELRGVKFLYKSRCRNIVLFTVGLEDPEKISYAHMEEKIHNTKGLERSKIFHLRGAMDFNRLQWLDKKIIGWVMKGQKNPTEMAEVETMIAPENKIDFVKKEKLAPIIEYVKNENNW